MTAEVVVLNSAMRSCERSGRWIEALMLLEDTKVLGADEVSILIKNGPKTHELMLNVVEFGRFVDKGFEK